MRVSRYFPYLSSPVAVFATMFVAACGRDRSGAAASGNVDAAVSAAMTPDIGSSPPPQWADEVRMYRWEEARRGIEALTGPARERGDARYALAVACDQLKDGKCAALALEGLETALPLLTERVFEMRARALERLGLHEAAADAWLRRETPDNLARAALALASGDSRGPREARALGLAERAIGSGRLSALLEAQLRALRMHGRDDTYAWQDAHWVFVHAPASPQGSDSLRRMLASKRPPTQDDWILRTHALVESQSLEAAIASLDRAATVNERKNSPLTLCRERARAFAATVGREVDAAVQFERCAKLAASTDGEDLYAEALSLASTEREEESAALYSHAVQRSPRASWAPDALYRAGRVRLLFGPWERTEKDFADLVRNYPTATEIREADLGRGLAFLAGKQWRKARATFERLGADTYQPVLAMRAMVLAGDAAWQDGDHDGALTVWRRVAAEAGPSWPSVAARSRLHAKGATFSPRETALQTPPAEIATAEAPAPLPAPVDLLHDAGLDDEAEAALRPRESLVVASARGQETEALCRAYSRLGRAARVLELSGRVPAAVFRGKPGASNAWAWACAYPKAYPNLVEDAANRAKIPAAWMYAILRQESLKHLLKKDGGRGLMGRTLASEQSPARQLDAGARMLADLLRIHKTIAAATTAFLSGSLSARRWAERSRVLGADQEVEAITDPEARAYVMGVLADLDAYNALSGSAGAAGREWELGGKGLP